MPRRCSGSHPGSGKAPVLPGHVPQVLMHLHRHRCCFPGLESPFLGRRAAPFQTLDSSLADQQWLRARARFRSASGAISGKLGSSLAGFRQLLLCCPSAGCLSARWYLKRASADFFDFFNTYMYLLNSRVSHLGCQKFAPYPSQALQII